MTTTVETARPINLRQLGIELGNTDLACAEDGAKWTVTCFDSAITRSHLQAAINAHVAIDEQGNRATLEQRAATAMADNRTFLALTSPTNAQTLAQVKLLTRECQAIIRLMLGRLDSTD